LIEEGLRRVVDESREISSSVRSLPRVSAARGGLRPGIDLEDSTPLEVDDIEYVRRFF
jgi:hypothetical protein